MSKSKSDVKEAYEFMSIKLLRAIKNPQKTGFLLHNLYVEGCMCRGSFYNSHGIDKDCNATHGRGKPISECCQSTMM